MEKMPFYLFFIGSIVLLGFAWDPLDNGHLYESGVGAIRLSFAILFLIIAISFREKDSYPQLLYRKLLKKMNSNKDGLRRELDE